VANPRPEKRTLSGDPSDPSDPSLNRCRNRDRSLPVWRLPS